MKGILCTTKAKTNEEYRKVIRKRMWIFAVLGIIGILTAALSFLTEAVLGITIRDYTQGFYCGVGIGLAVACILLFVKHGILLKNEEKLTQSRLECADERIEEINNKALRIALVVLLVVLYVTGLIGGIYYPILTRVLAIQIAFFIMVYLVARKVYEKKM